MAVLAVHRNKGLRVHDVDERPQLVLGGVARHVDVGVAAVVDRRRPRRTRLLMTRETLVSLPGIGVAEMMTVSSGSSVIERCSPCAISDSAANGSPWLPVQMTAVSSAASSAARRAAVTMSSGISRSPRLDGDLGVAQHRATEERQLAPRCRHRVDRLLHSVHVAGETGDDHPAFGACESIRGAARQASTPTA